MTTVAYPPAGDSRSPAGTRSGSFWSRVLQLLASFAVASLCLLGLLFFGAPVRSSFYAALLAGAAVLGFFTIVRNGD